MRLPLKFAILRTGHSQRQIAARAGIPESRFSSIVRGWSEPRDEERAALARLLGVAPDELFR